MRIKSKVHFRLIENIMWQIVVLKGKLCCFLLPKATNLWSSFCQLLQTCKLRPSNYISSVENKNPLMKTMLVSDERQSALLFFSNFSNIPNIPNVFNITISRYSAILFFTCSNVFIAKTSQLIFTWSSLSFVF